jgi:hypothetical protein
VNVNYRYVEDGLVYLVDDAKAKALVYSAEFAPRIAAIRDRLPRLDVLIQVADHSGKPLLDGAVDYESVTMTPRPAAGMPTPSADDLYILYTGGTTGMPKGVLWRQHDIFLSSMGGRPFGSDRFLTSYEELEEQASSAPGMMSLLMLPPLMHGAAGSSARPRSCARRRARPITAGRRPWHHRRYRCDNSTAEPRQFNTSVGRPSCPRRSAGRDRRRCAGRAGFPGASRISILRRCRGSWGALSRH